MTDDGTRLLELALRQLRQGQIDAAMDTLVQRLGDDPDDAEAHALLARCLLQRKRPHAAAIEARRAIEEEPESLSALLAAAAVAIAQRKLAQAQEHLHTAQSLYPDLAVVHDSYARLYLAWGREAQAGEHNRQACELDPEDTDYLALRAWLAFQAGDRAQAERWALEVLNDEPDHVEALCVLGHCALARGDADSAREHAAWALQIDPMDERALTLLGAIKARQNWLLGLWWRFQSYVSAGSRTRAVVLLLGMFLVYQITLIALDDHGQQQLIAPLSYLWLGFCLYTWIAPSWFWRSVRRELEQVRLRPNF